VGGETRQIMKTKLKTAKPGQCAVCRTTNIEPNLITVNDKRVSKRLGVAFNQKACCICLSKDWWDNDRLRSRKYLDKTVIKGK